MAGNYQNFLASIRDTGVAKTANFQLSIPQVPGILLTRFGGYDRLLALRCEATELPGRQLVSNDSRTYGPTYKTPYQSLYQELTLNFLETGDFFIRDFFETWMNNIFNSLTNLLNYPRNYRADVSLTQYDVFSTASKPSAKGELPPDASLDTIATWHIIDAFPTAVNQMPLAWSEDGLHRVTVTLAYEYYLLSKPERPQPQISTGAPKAPEGSSGDSFLGIIRNKLPF